MRRGGPGSAFGSAGFDHDDRLGIGYLASSREEGAGVADGFHVNDDALGVGIIAQIIDQVTPAHVEHRADGDEGLKPTFAVMLQSSTAVHKAPDWLIKPTLPGRAMPGGKGGVQAANGFITPRQLGPMMRIPPRRA